MPCIFERSLGIQRGQVEISDEVHEGWRLMCNKFDDGGLSGASLERPALQALLDEVRSGAIGRRTLRIRFAPPRARSGYRICAGLGEDHESLCLATSPGATDRHRVCSVARRAGTQACVVYGQIDTRVDVKRLKDSIELLKPVPQQLQEIKGQLNNMQVQIHHPGK